jgi:hypothetical protein
VHDDWVGEYLARQQRRSLALKQWAVSVALALLVVGLIILAR